MVPFSDAFSQQAERPFSLTRRTWFRVAALGLPIVGSGCGYVIGNTYPTDIRSVHVPTFTSEAYRRGFEQLLTEAVQKQITLRTPYKLTRGPDAQTRLVGHIRRISKVPTNQNRFDDPRELGLTFAVEIRWEDVATGQVLKQNTISLDEQTTQLVSEVAFTPESGQSLATASQELVDNLARQIVGMMEATW